MPMYLNDLEGPCECCGNDPAECICPPCPKCHVTGDPRCYRYHGLDYTNAQLLGVATRRLDELQTRLDEERNHIQWILDRIKRGIESRALDTLEDEGDDVA